MTSTIDQEIYAGFVEEVRSYLPQISASVNALKSGQSSVESLEAAYRYMHTIKGVAAMLGLDDLSQIAARMEAVLEAVRAEQLVFNHSIGTLLTQSVAQIKAYLADDLSVEHKPDFADIVQAYDHLLASVTMKDAHDEPVSSGTPKPEAVATESKEAGDDILDLMDVFSQEAEDHLRHISVSLDRLDRQPDDRTALQEVRRHVHTLKGAAGTVGLEMISQLTHHMEDVLDQLFEDKRPLTDDVMQVLFASAYTLEDLVHSNLDQATAQIQLQEIHQQYTNFLNHTSPSEVETSLDLQQTQPGKWSTIPDQPEQALDQYRTDPNPAELETAPVVTAPVLDPAWLAATEADPTLTAPGGLAVPEFTELPHSSDFVRVPIGRLDELVNLVSELVIANTTLDQRKQDLAHEVAELDPSVARLRKTSASLETEYETRTLGGHPLVTASTKMAVSDMIKVDPIAGLTNLLSEQTHGFDELEFDRYTEFHLLTRGLAETTSDVRLVGSELRTLIGDFDNVVDHFNRLTGELQQKLIRIRMVPLAAFVPRLQRTVRVVAQQRKKQADLVVTGEQVELDKSVWDTIMEPLLHLLRNAVDHGIESPEQRLSLGKPERGVIHLRASYEGNQVVITVYDDGLGLNPHKLRQYALKEGFISEAKAADMTDQEIQGLIFLPGFSTVDKLSEISGRGVGMDIVQANIQRLKGNLTLSSLPQRGTTFTIRLPMTLALARVLLVQTQGEVYAIPQDVTSQILRLTEESFEQLNQESVLYLGDKTYPVIYLDQALNLKPTTQQRPHYFPVLILKAEDREYALVVDKIIEARDVVVKSLGDHLRYVSGVAGATLMGNGTVLLILNPSELHPDFVKANTLIKVEEPDTFKLELDQPASSSGADGLSRPLTIMVVDDSISVRRVVSNMLRNANWQPIPARDGLEALELIQQADTLPDAILLDIEMPRMDGYELTATLRRHPAYSQIPIIILTSRAGEKHRQKAYEVGATEYVVKPYQDEVILNLIRKLTTTAPVLA